MLPVFVTAVRDSTAWVGTGKLNWRVYAYSLSAAMPDSSSKLYQLDLSGSGSTLNGKRFVDRCKKAIPIEKSAGESQRFRSG